MANEPLKPADELLALMLGQGKSIAQAARSLGITRETIYNKKELRAFNDRVDFYHDLVIADGVSFLGKSLRPAMKELKELIKSEDEKIRLSASKALGDLLLRARQIETLERRIQKQDERLKTLEGMLEQSQ
jgi:hypothetical protein